MYSNDTGIDKRNQLFNMIKFQSQNHDENFGIDSVVSQPMLETLSFGLKTIKYRFPTRAVAYVWGFGGAVPVPSLITSEVAGSILSENFLNVTRTQCSTHVKRVSQHSAEIRAVGFLQEVLSCV